jgi:hypothetical protein
VARLPLPLSFALLAAAACGSLTPEQRAAMARVQLVHDAPAVDCQNLGPTSAGSEEGLRAGAVVLGANTVRLDGSSSGTAFYCPPPSAPRLGPAIIHP